MPRWILYLGQKLGIPAPQGGFGHRVMWMFFDKARTARAEVLYGFDAGDDSSTDTGAMASMATIPASDLRAGRTYLLLGWAIANHSSSTGDYGITILTGSGAWLAGGWNMRNPGDSASSRQQAGLMALYKVPPVPVDLSIGYQPYTAGTLLIEGAGLLAIDLTNLTKDDDWKYGEGSLAATTASYVAGASVTFDANGTDDWLVIAHAAAGGTTTNSNVFMSIHNGTTDEPEVQAEGDAASSYHEWGMARVFTPSAGSHTFSARFKHEVSAEEINDVRIFALRLNAFAQHAFDYDSSDQALATTPSFTTIATVAPTPALTGRFVVLGYFGRDNTATSRDVAFRLQVDPDGGGLASNPAYGDTGVVNSKDASDETPEWLFTRVRLEAGGARTVNLDANRDSATTPPTAQHATLVAFSQRLA